MDVIKIISKSIIYIAGILITVGLFMVLWRYFGIVGVAVVVLLGLQILNLIKQRKIKIQLEELDKKLGEILNSSENK